MGEETRGGSEPMEDQEYAVPIYRHEAREREFEFAIGDEENIEAITSHFEKHVGPVGNVFHELISDLVHVDVHVIDPTEERPFYTLFTTGMSDRPMTVPDPAAEPYRYAELVLCLPRDWPVSEAFKTASTGEENRFYWPIRWMRALARFPHEFETWLFAGHTVPNGDPPSGFAIGTDLCCWWLAPPYGVPDEFSPLTVAPGKDVYFFNMVPIYADEMVEKLKKGEEGMLRYLEEARIPPDALFVLDPKRQRARRKRSFWPFGRGG